MSDFWTSSWGRVVRQIGVYAAGTIPFVGPLATAVVKALDAETFRPKVAAPRPAAQPAPPKPQPQGGVAIVLPDVTPATTDPGSLAAPPGVASSGQVGGGGFVDFFKGIRDDLQTVSTPGAPTPVLSDGAYFALGIAVLVLGYVLLSRFVRRR